MDRNFIIFTAATDPQAFAAALVDPGFSDLETQPQWGDYGRRYYAAVHGSAAVDASFTVHWQGRPVIIVLAACVNGVLGFYDLPMLLFLRDDFHPEVARSAVKAAFGAIDTAAAAAGARKVWVREPGGAMLSVIGEACLARQARADIAMISMVDLAAGPQAWKKALRKSFQQFLNWGRRMLTITEISGASLAPSTFDTYREFHARIAGRVTRPRSSWDVMYDQLARGKGELLLAEMEGRLVAGALFIDGEGTTIYMNGVYDRDLDLPLAHPLIWHGIERAAGRCQRRFQLGDFHQYGHGDPKRFQIGYFKRGFATHIEIHHDWRWQPGELRRG